MNADTWLTEYEHRLSMLLSQVFIYVKAPMHGDFSIFKMAAATSWIFKI